MVRPKLWKAVTPEELWGNIEQAFLFPEGSWSLVTLDQSKSEWMMERMPGSTVIERNGKIIYSKTLDTETILGKLFMGKWYELVSVSRQYDTYKTKFKGWYTVNGTDLASIKCGPDVLFFRGNTVLSHDVIQSALSRIPDTLSEVDCENVNYFLAGHALTLPSVITTPPFQSLFGEWHGAIMNAMRRFGEWDVGPFRVWNESNYVSVYRPGNENDRHRKPYVYSLGTHFLKTDLTTNDDPFMSIDEKTRSVIVLYSHQNSDGPRTRLPSSISMTEMGIITSVQYRGDNGETIDSEEIFDTFGYWPMLDQMSDEDAVLWELKLG